MSTQPFTKFGKTWTVHTLTADDLNRAPRQLDSLAKKYGVTPQQIVDANEVRFSTADINKWVMSTEGGRMLSSGHAVFAPGGRIFLPGQNAQAMAPGPVPPRPQAAQVKLLGVPWWAWVAAGGVGVAAMVRSRKGKKA